MADSKSGDLAVEINRSPVLQLWATIVAQKQGYPKETALSFARAIGVFMAQSKGRRLGVFSDSEESEEHKREKEKLEQYNVFNLQVRGKKCDDGVIRAVKGGKVLDEGYTEQYIRSSFGEHYDEFYEAFDELASSYDSGEELAHDAYRLYKQFRPTVSEDVSGWGKRANLRLADIKRLVKNKKAEQEE